MGEIQLERSSYGGMVIGIMRLHNPEKLNALDARMLASMENGIRTLGQDKEVRAVVITGTGEKAFSAGADISAFAGLSPDDAVLFMARGQEVFRQIESCPKPVIAAINGYALGGGLELALACDFRIASEKAKFGQPEITLANLPGWGGTQRLPHIVGEAIAKDLILSGRLIDASEALALHLIKQTAPANSLEKVALQLAGSLGSRELLALHMAKEAIHAARLGTDFGYTVERQGVGMCWGTSAQKAALDNLLNHRRSAK